MLYVHNLRKSHLEIHYLVPRILTTRYMAFFYAPKQLLASFLNEAKQIKWRSIASYVAFLVLNFTTLSFSQTGRMNGWAEAGTYIGNNSRLPFFLRANQFGTVPLFKPTVTGRAGFRYDSGIGSDTSQSARRHVLRWGAGGEVVANAVPGDKQLLLPEAYAKVGWKKVEFWVGRRKEVIGIIDTTLSSGSFTWSGNALPVPKMQIGFPQYVPIGFLKNYIALKGFFSHGWYNTPYIQGAYLHQKALHIRLGKPEWKFSIQAGLDHHVTWGGHAEYLKTSPHAVNGKLTDSFGDYFWGVVIGKIPKEFHNSRFTNFDGENRVGNHVGQFDFAFEYKFPASTLLLYNNHPFEDASGLLFQNMPDGLYGISWKNKKHSKSFIQIKGLVAEYLFSKDQSGEGWNVANSRFKGNDNYFNHQQYIEGWSYFGKGMGTPLIAPLSEIRPEAMGVREFFPSSRVIAYHVGLEGTVANRILWTAKVSMNTEYGTNNIVFDPVLHQFSSLLTVDAPLFAKANARLITRLAYDQGGFLASSFAGYIGVRCSGWIK